MSPEHLTYLVRLLNLVLGLVGTMWAVVRASQYWDLYPSDIKAYMMALIMFSFSTLYGTGESLAINAEPGFRVLFATIAELNLLAALWISRDLGTLTRVDSSRRPR